MPDLTAPSDAAVRHLEKSLEGLGTTVIDPGPAFTIDDFWVHDGHWRPSGHEKLARALIPRIEAELAKAGPKK